MVSQINAPIAAGAAGDVNLPARQRINIKTHCADFMAEDFSKLCHAGFFEATAGDIGSPLEQIDHFSFLVGQLVHEFLLRWRNVSFRASLGRKGQRNHNTNNKKPLPAEQTDAGLMNGLDKADTPLLVHGNGQHAKCSGFHSLNYGLWTA